MTSDDNLILDAFRGLVLLGIPIPDWFRAKELRRANGSVNLLAIIILADILLSFSLRIRVKDEKTGKVTGWKKRFPGDKLERSYGYLAATYGCSKRQATSACHFLRDRGLLTLEFRTVRRAVLDGDVTLSKVLYISPVREAIKKLGKTFS